MQNILRFLCTVLIVASGAILAGCGESYPTLPTDRSLAPEFTLLNQDGKPVSLKDYRGQWVVLYFYPEDFGKQSTADMHNFQKDVGKFKELQTSVLGISGDSVSTHKSFAEQEKLPFTLLADDGLRVAKQYGAFHKTHLVYHVVIYSTFVIDPTGKVAHVFYDFGPADPSGEILNMVNSLQHK